MTDRANEPIYVTKAFLPPLAEYEVYLKQIWDSHYLTNNGPLLKQFEEQIQKYLDVDNFQMLSNGTISLQLALDALGIQSGEVITTPFSYVATTSSILWQRAAPVFVDIDSKTLCIDAEKIEAAITPNTRAIMAVHVFGNPCDVDAIEEIASKHNLKVIYDAAHAFGVTYKGKSLLNYGDVSTLSFHATKLFHTIEGGGVVVKDKEVGDNIDLLKRFGHNSDEHLQLGVNGKASEFQAAMGLSNLKYIDAIIHRRKELSERYDSKLAGKFEQPVLMPGVKYNYAYYPIILDTEHETLHLIKKLNEVNVFPRRYFYPSLNELSYVKDFYAECPISEDISRRIICLPLYHDLTNDQIDMICKEIL